MEKKLEVETAKKLLEEANQMNPGGWYEHSLVVGEVAGRIAKAIGEDEEKAKAFGYIHDVGRRVGRCQLKHIYEGYKYLSSLGYEEAANICLTHSFFENTVEGVIEIPAYILGISTIAFLYFLLNTEKKYVKKNILSVILMIITIYLRGSRAIIATVFAMGFYVLILSNKLNFKKALKIILILIPIFMIAFYGYHLFFRNASESFYSYYSIDFSRDYTTIFSIYAHQNGINILEYPGQSFIFCLLFWLPRSIFPWKPYPFATYITLALLGSNINNVEYLSLRTTTNIFSESIANFGIIFGTIFIIIIIVLLIKSIDKVKNINFKFLLIYLAYEIMILDFANWVISFGFMSIIILLIEYENVIRDRIKEGINYVKSKI